MRSETSLKAYRCKKKAYRDKAAALIVLHDIQKVNNDKKKPVRVYRCEACKKWHITSQPIDAELHTTNYRPKLDWSKLIE